MSEVEGVDLSRRHRAWNSWQPNNHILTRASLLGSFLEKGTLNQKQRKGTTGLPGIGRRGGGGGVRTPLEPTRLPKVNCLKVSLSLRLGFRV